MIAIGQDIVRGPITTIQQKHHLQLPDYIGREQHIVKQTFLSSSCVNIKPPKA